MKRLPVILSFLFFVTLCVSLTYWALQWFQPSSRPIAIPIAVAAAENPLDIAAGLFGGKAAPAAVLANVQLKGVVVADRPRESVAIISIDNAPARAIGIAAEFQPGMTMREVHHQYVLITDNGATKRIDLPVVATAVQQSPIVAIPIIQSNQLSPAAVIIPSNTQLPGPSVPNNAIAVPGSQTVLSTQPVGQPAVTIVNPPPVRPVSP